MADQIKSKVMGELVPQLLRHVYQAESQSDLDSAVQMFTDHYKQLTQAPVNQA